MKTICLNFRVHQPLLLRQHNSTGMGYDDSYFDEVKNRNLILRLATNCYLPANKILLNIINNYKGLFKVSFSISGTTIDQLKLYAPEVIDSFVRLSETGCVEFLSETYSHSLAVLRNKDEFCKQIRNHSATIENLFGTKPRIFANTNLIYSDEIGATLCELGYEGVLAEGPKTIAGIKCPNFIYHQTKQSGIKVLFRNKKLSEDISNRFSDYTWSGWPINANRFVSKLQRNDPEEKIVNLFLNYAAFGEQHKFGSGIFRFLCEFPPAVFRNKDIVFSTPSEIITNYEPASIMPVIYPALCSDNRENLRPWIGNGIQQEAFEKLYGLSDLIDTTNDHRLVSDWENLQASDHFYFMSTRTNPDSRLQTSHNPYSNPFDAFMNYMNVINDLTYRLCLQRKERLSGGLPKINWKPNSEK